MIRVTTSNSNPFESGPRTSLLMALINFNVIFHLRVGFPSGVLPSDFPTKILHAPIFAPIHATCPSHFILLYLITHIVFGEEYRALSSFLYSLFPLPSYVVSLRPKCPPQHPVFGNLEPVCLCQCEQRTFTPLQNNRQDNTSVYLNPYTFG